MHTKYGCIKDRAGCYAELKIDPLHNIDSIITNEEDHVCLKSSHKSLQDMYFAIQAKKAAEKNVFGTTKQSFDQCVKE